MIGDFHVVLRFTEDGPAVTGAWTSEATALRKFRSFVGTYGSRDGVTVTLQHETDGGLEVLRTWTKDGGERTP